ncbi:hypothetical protein NIES2100_02650 [Calothrix sp. NIES-2100]|nr:hypothetical protein NIES2100_02650 [Calothrix sp. NIES-2100]
MFLNSFDFPSQILFDYPSTLEETAMLSILIAGITLIVIPAVVNTYFGYLLLRAKK